MSENSSKTGAIVWTDLTVPNAAEVRDFYSSVVGWESGEVSMGEYNDFTMKAADGKTVAGICHARGANAAIPPQWLVYMMVDNLDESIANCNRLGGKLIAGPNPYGDGRFAVIQDPAGAVCAIYQS